MGPIGYISSQFAPDRGEPILFPFAYFHFKVFAYSGGDLLDVRVHVNVNLSERTSLGREKEFYCPPSYFVRKDS